jgi:hypothetical protein
MCECVWIVHKNCIYVFVLGNMSRVCQPLQRCPDALPGFEQGRRRLLRRFFIRRPDDQLIQGDSGPPSDTAAAAPVAAVIGQSEAGRFVRRGHHVGGRGGCKSGSAARAFGRRLALRRCRRCCCVCALATRLASSGGRRGPAVR